MTDDSRSGESNRKSTVPRRTVLRATGVGATLPLLGGVATAGDDPSDGSAGRRAARTEARPPLIHPQFGYSGTSDDEVPRRFSPVETVGLHVDEEKIDDSNLPAITVEFGAFHFEPVGLHVDPGAVVQFDFLSPEHTVTAYHPDQGRQRRVPVDVAPFSSTVNVQGGFWLYRFDEPGVYDLFCTPHEFAGMGMRIVVGDDPGPVVREPGRPPLPMTAALLGTGLPPQTDPTGDPDLGHPLLAPENIVDTGSIPFDDVDLPLEVTITAPTPH